MADEDEDLVLEGSALHQHLVTSGFCPSLQSPISDHSGGRLCQPVDEIGLMDHSVKEKGLLDPGKRMSSLVWPESSDRQLEVELAQHVVRSELLVSEDEEFLNNFLLSEDRMTEYQREQAGGGGMLQDILMFSGSLAAVAGAVFLLSERTRLAATAAAVLPSALAAVSSVRLGARVAGSREGDQFQMMVSQMLGDMKGFKQLLRKSLNLIQGMEMMNQGYMYAVNSGGGASQQGPSTMEESKLSKALCKRSSFIALRRSIYNSTLQLVTVYRQAIQTLMELNPLADHIDLKDHYLAFIELENFGVEHNISDERLSVRQLKDTIQLTLLQQSEYLRRFSLTFCEKVRENEKLNKAGILKHVKEIISKIRTVSDKLGNVLEYHQALGLVPLPELEQRALTLKKQKSLDQVRRLLPLRNVYTSLFSTGLHLQNSLLKVRHLEGFFDSLEKRKSDVESPSKLIPDETQLIEWLQGFKEIQTELNACLTCLDDGVGEIDSIGRPGSSAGTSEGRSEEETGSTESLLDRSDEKKVRVVMDDKEEVKTVDEVFEAFIAQDHSGLNGSNNGFEDDFVSKEEVEKARQKKKQSKKVLQELKTVLVGKQKEWEVREAKAIARQAKVDSDDDDVLNVMDGDVDTNSHTQHGEENGYLNVPTTLLKTNILGLSQETDSDAESIRSDTNTIKSTEETDVWPLGPSTKETRQLKRNSKVDLKERFCKPLEEEILLVSKLGNTTENSESLAVSMSSRTGSSSEDSVMSDCEVDKSRRVYRGCSERVNSQGLTMSTSCTSSGGNQGMAGLRSISTPDFKRFNSKETTSPYVSLEKLLDEETEQKKEDSRTGQEDDLIATRTCPDFSSTSSSSSQELLGSDKMMFQRPLRPAALRRKMRLLGKSHSVDKGSKGHSHQSLYLSRQREEGMTTLVNSQPQGFDSRLAAAAVAKSRQMRQQGVMSGTGLGRGETEEYFGSEESESESGSSNI